MSQIRLHDLSSAVVCVVTVEHVVVAIVQWIDMVVLITGRFVLWAFTADDVGW